MRLNKIEVQAFRNIHNQTVHFSEGSTVLYGDNAQGKTNLLEAVYLLAAGKSFRARKQKEMVPSEKNFFRIACETENDGVKHTLAMSYSEKDATKPCSVYGQRASTPSSCNLWVSAAINGISNPPSSLAKSVSNN